MKAANVFAERESRRRREEAAIVFSYQSMEKQCLRPGEMHTNAQVRNAHKMCKCEMYTKGVSAKWPGASIAGREHSRARASLTSFWFLIGRASIAGRNKDSTKRMTCVGFSGSAGRTRAHLLCPAILN
jgi:hypothetical protein